MAAYKRRIYLINPPFQIKFSLLVCGLVFVSSIVYPMAIYQLINYFIALASERLPEQYALVMRKIFSGTQSDILIYLIAWQVIFMAAIFAACIFFSHKIAGPLYKLQKYFQKIRDGEPPSRLFFRKGDYFQDIAVDFNETFQSLYEKYQKDFAYISEVNAYLSNLSSTVPDDKKVILSEINRRLAEIQERFDVDKPE